MQKWIWIEHCNHWANGNLENFRRELVFYIFVPVHSMQSNRMKWLEMRKRFVCIDRRFHFDFMRFCCCRHRCESFLPHSIHSTHTADTYVFSRRNSSTAIFGPNRKLKRQLNACTKPKLKLSARTHIRCDFFSSRFFFLLLSYRLCYIYCRLKFLIAPVAHLPYWIIISSYLIESNSFVNAIFCSFAVTTGWICCFCSISICLASVNFHRKFRRIKYFSLCFGHVMSRDSVASNGTWDDAIVKFICWTKSRITVNYHIANRPVSCTCYFIFSCAQLVNVLVFDMVFGVRVRNTYDEASTFGQQHPHDRMQSVWNVKHSFFAEQTLNMAGVSICSRKNRQSSR